MGRRPKDPKHSEKALKMPEAKFLSLNHIEQQPECASPQKEKTNSVYSNGEKSTQLSLSRKKSKPQKFPIRRSRRIQNIIVPFPAPNREIQHVVQEIVDSDKEEEPLAFEEENVPEKYVSKENVSEQCASEKENVSEQYVSGEEEPPAPTSGEKTLAAKIDHITQLLEAQEKTIETVKLKVKKSSFPSNSADMRYKDLYIDSQKKVEVLTKEKNELALKLENALGKLEAFEKGIPGLSEIQKLKEIIFIQQLTKATEAAVNGSSQAVRNDFSSENPAPAGFETGTAAKRKKALQ